ncbi:MAG TPA: UvrD-helicase domain-containing protein [Candidatus Kapabacteria bacterium]|nr:UvrD-helicase domain-containing protein [Candidatus Kapabacteria bacterium]
MAKLTLKRADASAPNLFEGADPQPPAASSAAASAAAGAAVSPAAAAAESPAVNASGSAAPPAERPAESVSQASAAPRDLRFLAELNDVQREAVTTSDGPLLIVAGAGSGKTRVLTFRIAYLLASGVRPWSILALTFTNKAAREMKERIADLVGHQSASPLWMGTFHSVFSRILRREAATLGYTSSFTIYDTDDSLGVVRSAMTQYGITQQDFPAKMILHRISQAKNNMISPAEFRTRATSLSEEKIALVYEAYESRLRTSNAMDFDDLLVKTIALFEKDPAVLRRYQEQFRYVLIDEYQDTNRAQYVVVRMIAEHSRNICVVGDDAQSIYRFRGADIRNILDFERDYPDFRIFRLEQNYRSTKTIIAAADDVIRQNRMQIPKSLWTDNDEGEKIKVLTLRDEREEGEEVARIIQRHQRQGRPLGEIAVLYRTNSQSLSIEDGLRRANIPYGIVGSVAFYRRREVKDALAYLRLLVNERDDESFLRAVNTPARGVGEVSVRRLRHHATEHGLSLFEAARRAERISDLGTRVAHVLHGFTEMLDKYRGHLGDMSPAELSRTVLSESGLLQAFKDENTPEALARWDNVQRILSHIAEYSDNTSDGSLDQYLQEISLLSEVDQFDPTIERVTLMTVHSAKGLEYDVVLVTGLEEGLFPVGNSAQEQEDLEEERRLFYVAITRARRHLYFVNCERRYRFGELSYPTPSRFLNEISDHLLEFNATAPPASRSRPSGEGFLGGGTTRRERTRPAAIDTESQEMPADDYSQVPRALQVGSRVAHATFGVGKVEAVVGSGDKTKITVRFEGIGRKQLMLKFANLQVL